MTTKTTQFTPGPWVVNTFIVNGQHKLEVLDATGANACVQANAHLIAAAPAMYAELVAGLVLLEASYQDMCGKYGTDSLHAQTVWERVERTRQVIAQAEGRQ